MRLVCRPTSGEPYHRAVEDEQRERTEETERSNVIRDEEVGRAAAYGRATAILAVVGMIVSAFRQLTWRDRFIVDVPVANWQVPSRAHDAVMRGSIFNPCSNTGIAAA